MLGRLGLFGQDRAHRPRQQPSRKKADGRQQHQAERREPAACLGERQDLVTP
jgi:hypothetical protein